jgi:hypothetical protein
MRPGNFSPVVDEMAMEEGWSAYQTDLKGKTKPRAGNRPNGLGQWGDLAWKPDDEYKTLPL